MTQYALVIAQVDDDWTLKYYGKVGGYLFSRIHSATL